MKATKWHKYNVIDYLSLIADFELPAGYKKFQMEFATGLHGDKFVRIVFTK